MRLDGWLNIDKPPGITSYGVIARLKRLTGQRHIGHAGTLDPLATGVLPVAFGQAARTVEFLHQVSKTYRAVMELGVETDTLDAEGKVIFSADASNIDRQAVETALKPVIGVIEQVPPMYSAIKRNGTPLYELARRGETVEIKPRAVTIYCLDLIEYSSPLVTIDVECGSGTYIRSIARDLGQNLKVGAHLKSLRRTRYGEFDIKIGIHLDSLQSATDVETALLPIDFALSHLPSVELDDEAAEKISHGVVPDEVLSQLVGKCAYRLYRPGGELLAVIDAAAEDYRLKVLTQMLVDS
jgi:tRNA pseudouridine55 synthase